MSSGRSPSIVPSISSYNSSTLPRKQRAPASLPNSIDFLHLLTTTTTATTTASSTTSSTSAVSSGRIKKNKDSSSPNKIFNNHTSDTSTSCDICKYYGHPWIDICKAIKAKKF